MKMANSNYQGKWSFAATVAILTGSIATSSFGWSAAGTVKSGGTALSDVTVSVKNLTPTTSVVTNANGEFNLTVSGVELDLGRNLSFSARIVDRELLLQCPKDGPVELSLVDGSGRMLWSASTQAVQGVARSPLPSELRYGTAFLRVKHAEGISVQPITTGPDGFKIASHLAGARSLAVGSVLEFKKTGYNDTTYTMTAESQNGISVVMSAAGPSVTCPMPTTFKWKDYGKPVAAPQNGWASIKDFTHVFYNGMHYVHMTYYTTGWNAATIAPFANWADANAAKQTSSNTGVAPELMYFTPKKTWINSKQWCGGASFCWMEATDLNKPSSFALKGNLLTETITDDKKAPIDHTLICDDNKCYIFYADDNGRIYSGSMPKANFPGTFTGTKKILQDTQSRLFEAVQVYKIKGQKLYLMIVECMSPRYFRAFTATDLGGTWTPLANATTQAVPFAGKNNVTGGWSDDISHGDLVRSTYDEYREVDPCNLQLIYQGYKPPFSGDYGKIPYQLGLLTLVK
ncbi:MAG: hypothetical protein IPK50_01145 [Fibrobacterota bacterium]|nr:hypothetical protein [Fibrobacterota bacterium]QQS05519.1 MAG: hypothetical protein IPK50_01145 [Fibrobacterota bacterium]